VTAPAALPAHWKWRSDPQQPADAAIVDIDGVLADASHRQWHLDGPRRDWAGFFAAASGDTLLAHHAELVRCLDPRMQVVLLTARPFRLRQRLMRPPDVVDGPVRRLCRLIGPKRAHPPPHPHRRHRRLPGLAR